MNVTMSRNCFMRFTTTSHLQGVSAPRTLDTNRADDRPLPPKRRNMPSTVSIGRLYLSPQWARALPLW